MREILCMLKVHLPIVLGYVHFVAHKHYELSLTIMCCCKTRINLLCGQSERICTAHIVKDEQANGLLDKLRLLRLSEDHVKLYVVGDVSDRHFY